MPYQMYERAKGPDRMPWDEYAGRAKREYTDLLESDPDEVAVQQCLEENPALAPGAWRSGPAPSGHFPLHCALISQPLLAGLQGRRPDLMWVATDSGTWYPTLIELERPGKKLFTIARVPTAQFTEARNQLAQWRVWFNSPANQQKFIEEYGIPDEWRQSRLMKLHMILVYGRREETDGDPELSRQRASLMTGSDETLMSYDRLEPDKNLDLAITVRAVGSRRYQVLRLPPTFGLMPALSDRLLYIDGFEEALEASPHIRPERRAFLRERLVYSKEWAAAAGRKSLDFSVE